MPKVRRDLWILIIGVFAAGVTVGFVALLVVDRNNNIRLISQKAKLKKSLSKCRMVLASQDAQVSTDLMKLTAQVEGITKRVKVMSSLLSRDAEFYAELKWFIHLSKRLEKQGMVGCTHKRNKRGKLRKCFPKFNISDCKKDKGYWTCPIPEPHVVKGRGRRKK